MNKKQLIVFGSVLIIVTIYIFLKGSYYPPKSNYGYNSTKTTKSHVLNYQVISEEDRTIGKLDFWLQKRYEIKIPYEIKTKEEAISIINPLVKELSSRNKKVDEIRIYLYDIRRDANYYPGGGIATIDWAPYGTWAGGEMKLYESNDRSKHKISILWHNAFEDDLRKSRKTLSEILTENLNSEFTKKINNLDGNVYKYDPQSGYLYIKIHEKIFTKESGYKERGYPDKITLDDLYSAASIIGIGYMKDYNEIKSCHFELIWKDKPVFVFNTTREEFDKIPLKELERNLYAEKDRLSQKEDVLIKQGLLKGGTEYFDKHSKSEKELDLKYYKKLFEYIKDKQIDNSGVMLDY